MISMILWDEKSKSIQAYLLSLFLTLENSSMQRTSLILTLLFGQYWSNKLRIVLGERKYFLAKSVKVDKDWKSIINWSITGFKILLLDEVFNLWV